MTYDAKVELEHCSISTSKEEETSFLNDPKREVKINLENIFYERELSSTRITNNKLDFQDEFIDHLLDPNME